MVPFVLKSHHPSKPSAFIVFSKSSVLIVSVDFTANGNALHTDVTIIATISFVEKQILSMLRLNQSD